MDDGEYYLLCDVVAHAFVDDVPEYLQAQVTDITDDQIGSVVLAAHAALSEWKVLRAREQQQTPLELLRTALAPVLPAEKLPVTSRDLSEDSWRVHVAWGIARAELIAGVVPSESVDAAAGVVVAIVSTNLIDRTRIEEAVRLRGAVPVVWRNPGAVAEGLATVPPAVAFVDLEHGAAHDLLRLLVDAGVRTAAYGPHVDDHALAAAKALGAADVLPRSQFFRRLESLIPTVA